MNEQQNTALIQKAYDAFGRGDIQTIIDMVTEDVEWGLEGPEGIAFAGVKKGQAGVRTFFDQLGGTLRDMKLSIECFVAQNDQVASMGRFSGTVVATGKSFDTPIAHFFTFRAGKVARFVDFTDTAATVEAYTKTSAASR